MIGQGPSKHFVDLGCHVIMSCPVIVFSWERFDKKNLNMDEEIVEVESSPLGITVLWLVLRCVSFTMCVTFTERRVLDIENGSGVLSNPSVVTTKYPSHLTNTKKALLADNPLPPRQFSSLTMLMTMDADTIIDPNMRQILYWSVSIHSYRLFCYCLQHIFRYTGPDSR